MTRTFRSTPTVWSKVYDIPAATPTAVLMPGFPAHAAYLEVVKVGIDGGDIWGRLDGQAANPEDDNQEYMREGNLAADFEFSDQSAVPAAAGGVFTWSVHYAAGGKIYVKVRESL